MARILVVDDEQDLRHSLAEALRDASHEVVESGTTDEGIYRVRSDTFDVVITDLRMPGRIGTELLREAAARMPDCILMVMTAYGSLESAIDALRIGAHDYIPKPLDLQTVVQKINMLLRHQATLAENRFLRGALEIDVPATGLVGTSAAMVELHRLIAKVAPTDSTVLIHGETGTGKELAARAIHQISSRREKPFVAINCGSIPETLLESELFGHVRGAFTGADRDKRGLFEVAGEGTIFLDEIGEMPLTVQPKILRALENREVLRVGSTTPLRISARIIAATHRDLPRMIADGAFRQDLYYRLNVFELTMPPLRARPEDIRPLAAHCLERLCRTLNRPPVSLSPEALRALEQYRWPGNARELANILERALILAETSRINLADLPGIVKPTDLSTEDDLKAARRAFERAHILSVIAKYGGEKRPAAEALGIDLSSLYRKLDDGNAE